MKFWLIFAAFAAVLLCDSVEHKTLYNNGAKVAVPFAAQARVINHTPDVIWLQTDEKRGVFTVRARAKSGKGVVEGAPPFGETSLFYAFEITEVFDPFKVVFSDKNRRTQIITDGDITANGEELVIGARKGVFRVDYLGKDELLKRKQIVVLNNGVIALDAMIEVASGESKTVLFNATTNFTPQIIIQPEKGAVEANQNKIVYTSDHNARGTDFFVIKINSEIAVVNVDISEKKSLLFVDGKEAKNSFERVKNSVRQKVNIDLEGNVRFEMRDMRLQPIFTLDAPPKTRLFANENGIFLIEFDKILVSIGTNAALKGIAHGSQISVFSAHTLTIYEDSTAKISFSGGEMMISYFGTKIISNGESAQFAPHSNIIIDHNGTITNAPLTP